MQEDAAARVVFDELKREMGEYSGILETHDRLMRVVGAPLAVFLTTVWVLRLPIDLPVQVSLIIVCTLATLFACVRSFVKITFTHEEGQDVFAYQRRGVSWGFLVSSLIGATVVFAAIRFLAENGLPDSQAIGTGVILLATVVTVLIVPVTPLLANIPRLSFLKTSLEVMIDTKKELATHSRISICSGDSFVPNQAQKAEILRRLDALSSVLNPYDKKLDNA
jgi:hypothetical protein